MLIDKIREEYPDPIASNYEKLTDEEHYCVLGACLKFAVAHGVLEPSMYVPFPSIDYLCNFIWPSSDTFLWRFKALYAAKLNDRGFFEDAWKELEFLLRALPSNTPIIEVLKGDY